MYRVRIQSGERKTQKGGDICIHIAESQHCTRETNTYYKAIILQLKTNFKKGISISKRMKLDPSFAPHKNNLKID